MVSEEYRAEVEREIARPRQSIAAAVAALGLGPGGRVLDVGCGAGPHLGLFARAGAPGGQVIGLDRAADRLALAGELWRAEVAVGAIALREGDHDALPFADGAFDAAWSSMVLHHAEDPQTMLGEMRRVVRPGGTVAVLDGDAGGSYPILPWPPDLEMRLRLAGWEAQATGFDGKLPYHFSGYTGRQLPRLLREAGLTDVRILPLPDVDRAPLDPRREAEIRGWFTGPFADRVRDFLAPRDWARFAALFAPDAPDYLLADPDFFLARTFFLGLGRVPAHEGGGARPALRKPA
jgi:SAM-dependent methyltransferase